MTGKFNLASVELQLKRLAKRSSAWICCFALCIALSSAALFNFCHGATAPASHAANLCARIVTAGIACECAPMPETTTEPASDDPSDPVMRIDEDWELVVTEPDMDLAAPQIQTVMSPCQNLDGLYICFMVNHRNNPAVAVGGLEVQFWYGDTQVGARKWDAEVLHHSNETIRWTQRLMVKGDSSYRWLCFRVVDGTSDSWGSFGGDDPLHMNIDTSRTSLSDYSSALSVANSGVFFSSNRVARLVLRAVRGYSETGTLLFEESTPVVVYECTSQ